MAYLLGIFHGNCDLRNVGGVLEFRKIDLRRLKGHVDVKNGLGSSIQKRLIKADFRY